MAARFPGADYNDKKYPQCGITSPETTPELHPNDESIDARRMNEPASFVVDRLERDSLGADLGELKAPSTAIVSVFGLGLAGVVVGMSTNKTVRIIGAVGGVFMLYSLLTSIRD